MWAPSLARSCGRALSAAARGGSITVPRPTLARALCTGPRAQPGGEGTKQSSGGGATPKPPESEYAGYYVRRGAASASSSSSGGAAGKDGQGGGGGGGGSGSGGGGSGGSGGGNGASWEKWIPYVFGGGVAASYFWLASREEGSDRDTVAQSGESSGGMPPEGLGREVSWKQFQTEALSSGRVSKIEVVNGQTANVYFRDGIPRPRMRFSIGSVETLERKLERAQEDLGLEPHEFVPVVYSEETSLSRILVDWIPTLAFVTAYILIARRLGAGGMPGGMGGLGGGSGRGAGSRTRAPFNGGGGQQGRGMGPFGGMGGPGGGIFSVGKAKATVLNRDNNKVEISFKDVAGLDEAKEEIMEFVQYLKKPDKYKELGAKIPKGALMFGPPGTGKTLLAKATAGEAGVPFLTMSGSDFMEMFVGVGPSRVRDLFAQARSMAPCIIFLDEIDAIGRKRGRSAFAGANDERENTLNQLLVEMDGFATNSGVVVLGGTNRVDVLDQALLRPGRFDRQISIDPPDIAGRKEIFLVHLKGITVAELPGKDEIAKAMSARTPGFAGADIANVCNEAALLAARKKKEVVEMDDFEAAVDRVVGGLEKKNMVMSPEEKRTVAFHEAGHAVAGWFLEHAMPLLKVSIIPRGTAALGYAQYQPLERYLLSQEALIDQMCMTLAGRAAEEIFFDSVTTGAADDFNKVTKIAYQSVAEWGLGTTIRNLAFPGSGSGESEDGSFYRPYSDRTAREMDEEVRDLVGKAYTRTKNLLLEKKDSVTAVANLLLAREAIGRDDMVRLLGERPWGEDRASFDEILEDAKREQSPAA